VSKGFLARLRERPLVLLVELVFWKQILREWESVVWTFFVPLILALVLAFAFHKGPTTLLPVGVVTGEGDSGALLRALAEQPGLTVESVSRGAGEEAVRTGRLLVLVAPGEPPVLTLDTRQQMSTVAQALVVDAAERAVAAPTGPTPVIRSIDSQSRRYIDFLFAGLIGLSLLASSMQWVCSSITTARTSKFIRQIAVTPAPRGQYLLSILIGRVSLAVIEVVFFSASARLLFSVHVQGSFLFLILFAVLGALSFSGIALLVAARITNQSVASAVSSLIQFPLIILSGVFFQGSSYPDWVQPILRLIPLTAVVNGLRAISLDGAGPSQVVHEMVVLGAWGLVSFAVGLKIFRWR